MSGYTYTIEVSINDSFDFVEGLSAESAYAQQEALLAEWSAAGYVLDDLTGDWVLEGSGCNSVGVYREADEEEDSPWSEAEQGWRNIRADEAAAVARQNAEDAVWSSRPQSSYMDVAGRMEPDGSWIYEP